MHLPQSSEVWRARATTNHVGNFTQGQGVRDHQVLHNSGRLHFQACCLAWRCARWAGPPGLLCGMGRTRRISVHGRAISALWKPHIAPLQAQHVGVASTHGLCKSHPVALQMGSYAQQVWIVWQDGRIR